MKNLWIILLVLGFVSSCNSDTEEETTTTEEVKNVTCPQFSGDSTFALVQKQVDFGPRIPNTAAQKNCAAWIESHLKSYCDTIITQTTTVKVSAGQVPCINIMGQINPSHKKRVVLFAHWDTRPWADKENKSLKLDGADDGASGVAVLLEVARLIKTSPLNNMGVDFVFFDVEDYGDDTENSYCVGSQYWTTHTPIANYTADYGILLDMVGGRGNVFPQEGMSVTYAPTVINNVWNVANSLGFQALFKYTSGFGVTDDHVYVNKNLGIPTIDIIGTVNGDFPAHHHTSKDNMQVIDPNTLQAVGQTLMQVLYNENAGVAI